MGIKQSAILISYVWIPASALHEFYEIHAVPCRVALRPISASFPPCSPCSETRKVPRTWFTSPKIWAPSRAGVAGSATLSHTGPRNIFSVSRIRPRANSDPAHKEIMALLSLGILIFSVSFLCYRHPPSSWSFLEWLRRPSVQDVARKQQCDAPRATNHDRHSEPNEKVPEIIMGEPCPVIQKAEYVYLLGQTPFSARSLLDPTPNLSE